MNCASCPPARIFSTVLAPRVSSRPVMITDAPFSAIASAAAIPIPEVPPVIKARLSFRSIVDVPSVVGTCDPFLLTRTLTQLAHAIQYESIWQHALRDGFP